MKKFNTICLSTFLLLNSFALFSCNDSTSSSNSNIEDNSSKDDENKVFVSDLKLDDERKYTGYLVNELPNGEGKLTWILTNCIYEGQFKNGKYDGNGTFSWLNDGNTLVGTFKDNVPVEGKFTYANTMSYTGMFNENWQFHGKGVFDWNTYKTDGSVLNYGWLYEGEFKNGSPAGCVGKVTFPEARNGLNGAGIHYFEGIMDGFPSIKKSQQGTGKIVYPDGSYYVGDVFYEKNFDFYRLGNGMMDFTKCNFSGSNAGGTTDSIILKYIGEFDYKKSGWMYGNSIMYYGDDNLNPKYYIKGFWSGTALIKKYSGKETLLDEFKNTNESNYYFNYPYMQNYIENKYPQIKNYKAIICGDSYTDMMHKQFNIIDFDEQFKDYDVIDTGIGGTCYYEWLFLAEKLIVPYNPETIILHLGFNDLHMHLSPQDTLTQADLLVKYLKEKLPNAKIVLMSVEPSPAFKDFFEIETNYNNLLRNYCNSNDISLIDHAQLFIENNKPISNLNEYFISDNVHLNQKGYQTFIDLIKQHL